MTDARAAWLLAAAADLDERDRAAAQEHAEADALLVRADGVRRRSEELQAFLDGVPAEREALARAADEADAERVRAGSELASAEQRLAELESKRRPPADDVAQAQRELERAREAVVDADARIARTATRRAELDEAEIAAHAEAEGLGVEARAVAAALRDVPRLSESGRAEPGSGLAGLAAWGARAHAALFVVLGALVAERERIGREAAELGSSVVGEPLGGSSVSAVRRRIEETLGA